MGWRGPTTDWQYVVCLEHLRWENRDPNAGPEFDGDPEVWKRWSQKVTQARFDLSGSMVNARRKKEKEDERNRARAAGGPPAG